MRILGVDYGATGGLALIDTETGKHIIFDMPMIDKDVDVLELEKKLFAISFPPLDAIYVEDFTGTGTMAGKASLKQQGKNIGMAEAVVLMFAYKHQVPFTGISAQKWERFQGLWGKDKKDACAKALSKYPTMKDILYGPRGGAKDGRADALLVADYGVHHHA